ncbi:ABC transporter substrate-binding protein [Cohnella boryungensis]|uniref:ABC transporter substrate-binding protein n=1 Tax=Cohnella boryungensis TaxID=768479 RepID=A0ABV8SGK0_9BACL
MALWKRLSFISAVAVLCLSLAACGVGISSPIPSIDGQSLPRKGEGPDGENIKLRIMWWGAQTRHKVTMKALEAYAKEHPNVTFEADYSGMDGYLDRLTTQAAAKNAPDIIQIDPGWVADWAYRNQLADLTGAVDLTNIDDKLTNLGHLNDKLYAVPLGSVAHGMIYDKAAMEKSAIPLPINGWTWEDFFKLARESTPKLGAGQYFTKDYAGDVFAYSAYQYARGKGALITDAGQFNIDNQVFLEWAYQWQDLRASGAVPPADVNAADKEFDPSADLMIKGTILIRLSYSSSYGAWDSIKPGAYALVTMPRAEEAGGWLKPSLFFGISAASKHVEEAKAFIDWFVNSEDAGKILGTSRGVPVNSAVADAIDSTFSEADQTGMVLYNATLRDGQQWTPGASGWTNWIDKDWSMVRDELSFGKKSPEQAFDALQNAAKEYEG